MKEVYFKSLMIADLQNRTARVQLFEKGLNVVTSADNHVGKSSLQYLCEVSKLKNQIFPPAVVPIPL